MGMRSVYRQMLLAFPRLLYALLPSFVSPFKMFRMLEILLHARRSEAAVGWPSYELLSIAVDPSSRGRGVSDRLYMGLVDHCRSSGIASFRIVVGAGLDSAHRFYSRMGAEVVGNVQVHGGQDSLVYVQITAEAA
jgi:GNAT superfamily N-acetyltransferase